MDKLCHVINDVRFYREICVYEKLRKMLTKSIMTKLSNNQDVSIIQHFFNIIEATSLVMP